MQRAFHAVADLFPVMHDDELQALADDIKANGLRVPIVVNEAGEIVDGRHRYLACERAGIEPIFVTSDASDLVALVASLNAKRRNLSASQRAMAAAEAWDMVDVRSRGNQSKERKNALNGKRSEHLGPMFGVGARYVEQARFVVENDPPAAAAVKAGAQRLSEAYEAARERKTAASSGETLLAQIKAEDAELGSMVVEGKLTVAGAMAELRERKDRARLERHAAMVNLHEAMLRVTPYAGEPDVVAASIWRNWDRDQFPAGPLKLDAPTLEKCGAVFAALAALLRKEPR